MSSIERWGFKRVTTFLAGISGSSRNRPNVRLFLAALTILFFSGGIAFAQCKPSAGADMISTVSAQLMTNCWSCQLYSSIFYGLRAMVNTSYGALIGVDAGTMGAPILGITILAITLMVKFIPFLTGSQDSFELITSLRLFLMRVSIVFLVFIGADGITTVEANGVVSNFLIDGPLAMGTAVAESLSNTTSTALEKNVQSLSGATTGSLFGTPNPITPAETGGNADMNGGTSGFAAEHVRAAETILMNLHQMGVIGLVTGLWLAIEDPDISKVEIGTTVVGMSAALFMIWTFFLYTLTFGLKYIDALIRSMLIFSLSPLFFYLWIFDSTRGMAIQALKSGLSLACVWAVSGVVYTVAFYILELGYLNAFANQGMDFAGLQQLFCNLDAFGTNSIASLIGVSGQGASINWMTYFYLVGSASVATACASMAFDLAGQIFAFQSADMGIANSVKSGLSSGVNQAMNTLRGSR
jgi:hypothetical protein